MRSSPTCASSLSSSVCPAMRASSSTVPPTSTDWPAAMRSPCTVPLTVTLLPNATKSTLMVPSTTTSLAVTYRSSSTSSPEPMTTRSPLRVSTVPNTGEAMSSVTSSTRPRIIRKLRLFTITQRSPSSSGNNLQKLPLHFCKCCHRECKMMSLNAPLFHSEPQRPIHEPQVSSKTSEQSNTCLGN